MTLKASGVLAPSENIQYLCTLLHGESLHQIDTLCAKVESTDIKNYNRIILGLGTYFYPINTLSNQKHAMHRRMRNPRELKVRRYAAHMIELN